ncbi:LPS export ABC transporter permease LptF [Vibrio sp. S4M6]|uniref:LPS export ABC transporter permease LptF n=1 Tax=Vibrio sinus TaxID=2946865 RepID=UPI00202A8AC4|nr:LPS export ABC transporter permease LptF [Vibrio sinus]
MIIVRYLIRETLKSQLAIFFVLFLVFLSQQFISVLGDASDGNIPANMILSIVGLNMPRMGQLMLPLSIFVGILLTFGRLYAESEITVMNATGIGNKFLVHAALYLAVITMAVAGFNSLWLSPWGQHKVDEIMTKIAAEDTVELLKKGTFQPTPDGSSVIFIDNIKDKKLTNVFVAQLRPRGSLLPSVIFSHTGDITESNTGRQVITLYDGTRYEGVPTRLDYMITNFDKYTGVIGKRAVGPPGRDWQATPTLDLIKMNSLPAKAELQWRISLVICIPLLTMLVVPLSRVNPRQGRFAKMGPAILIYLTYFLLISAMKSSIEDGSIPTWIGLWPANAILLLGAIVVNSLDGVYVRKLKERFKLRKKKVA